MIRRSTTSYLKKRKAFRAKRTKIINAILGFATLLLQKFGFWKIIGSFIHTALFKNQIKNVCTRK